MMSSSIIYIVMWSFVWLCVLLFGFFGSVVFSIVVFAVHFFAALLAVWVFLLFCWQCGLFYCSVCSVVLTTSLFLMWSFVRLFAGSVIDAAHIECFSRLAIV